MTTFLVGVSLITPNHRMCLKAWNGSKYSFTRFNYKATGQENPSKQEQALNYTGSGICLTFCQSFMTLSSIKGQSKDIEANCTKSLPLNKQEMQIDKRKKGLALAP